MSVIKKKKSVYCVIPVYNNAATIEKVVKNCCSYINNILVVDDGSTDIDIKQILKDYECVEVITHDKNSGKGAALKTAAEYLTGKNIDYMITIDADDQHYAEDINQFLSAIEGSENSIIIGCRDFNTDNVPDSSKFGRKFSNMWVRLETGLNLSDTQSGYRVYPVKYISQIKTFASSYNYEIEILVKAVWKGLNVKEIPIKTFYPESSKRVSHFKPYLDNFRLSNTHAMLIGRRLLPIPVKKFFKKENNDIDFSILFHPIRIIKTLVKEHSTPQELALSAFVGTFLAVIPMPGLHSFAIIYSTAKLRLNKVLAFNVQHFFMPPFTPFLCIEAGHYLLYQKFLIDLTFKTLIVQMPYRILEWVVGSLILAPIFAFIMSFLVYGIAKFAYKRRNKSK